MKKFEAFCTCASIGTGITDYCDQVSGPGIGLPMTVSHQQIVEGDLLTQKLSNGYTRYTLINKTNAKPIPSALAQWVAKALNELAEREPPPDPPNDFNKQPKLIKVEMP